MDHPWPKGLERVTEKNVLPSVFSSFCLSQGCNQCVPVINDYHIVYSHIILNMSTFSKAILGTVSWI